MPVRCTSAKTEACGSCHVGTTAASERASGALAVGSPMKATSRVDTFCPWIGLAYPRQVHTSEWEQAKILLSYKHALRGRRMQSLRDAAPVLALVTGVRVDTEDHEHGYRAQAHQCKRLRYARRGRTETDRDQDCPGSPGRHHVATVEDVLKMRHREQQRNRRWRRRRRSSPRMRVAARGRSRVLPAATRPWPQGSLRARPRRSPAGCRARTALASAPVPSERGARWSESSGLAAAI